MGELCTTEVKKRYSGSIRAKKCIRPSDVALAAPKTNKSININTPYIILKEWPPGISCNRYSGTTSEDDKGNLFVLVITDRYSKSTNAVSTF